MSILEELGNNIHLYDRQIVTEEYKELLRQIVAMQDALQKELSPQGRELLDEMCCKSNELHAEENNAAFVSGFRLGVQILLESIGCLTI